MVSVIMTPGPVITPIISTQTAVVLSGRSGEGVSSAVPWETGTFGGGGGVGGRLKVGSKVEGGLTGGATGGGATGCRGPELGPMGPGHQPLPNDGWETITVNAIPATSCAIKRKLNFFITPLDADSDIGSFFSKLSVDCGYLV